MERKDSDTARYGKRFSASINNIKASLADSYIWIIAECDASTKKDTQLTVCKDDKYGSNDKATETSVLFMWKWIEDKKLLYRRRYT